MTTTAGIALKNVIAAMTTATTMNTSIQMIAGYACGSAIVIAGLRLMITSGMTGATTAGATTHIIPILLSIITGTVITAGIAFTIHIVHGLYW
jgi:hypothetical protein